jgi:hypothetical protein
MHLRRQSQWGRFKSSLPTDLLSDFLVDHPVQLACTPLPGQLLLERERTPGTAGFDLRGPQPQQQQVRHYGNSHRALHSSGLLGHLVLAQAHDTLEFLDTEFHRPASQTEGTVRCAVACGRLDTSSLVYLGLSLCRRRLNTTVTSPTCANCACLANVQKARRRGH